MNSPDDQEPLTDRRPGYWTTETPSRRKTRERWARFGGVITASILLAAMVWLFIELSNYNDTSGVSDQANGDAQLAAGVVLLVGLLVGLVRVRMDRRGGR